MVIRAFHPIAMVNHDTVPPSVLGPPRFHHGSGAGAEHCRLAGSHEIQPRMKFTGPARDRAGPETERRGDGHTGQRGGQGGIHGYSRWRCRRCSGRNCGRGAGSGSSARRRRCRRPFGRAGPDVTAWIRDDRLCLRCNGRGSFHGARPGGDGSGGNQAGMRSGYAGCEHDDGGKSGRSGKPGRPRGRGGGTGGAPSRASSAGLSSGAVVRQGAAAAVAGGRHSGILSGRLRS